MNEPPFQHDPTIDYEHQVATLLKHVERQALRIHDLEHENRLLRAGAALDPELMQSRGHRKLGTSILFGACALLGYTLAGGLGIGISAAFTTAWLYRIGWSDAER